MDNSEWQKHGRDAAREDIAGGAPPCTTIAEARKRIRAWITADSWQPDTIAITADEAEACAAAYLATWQARAGTAPDNTSPAGLNLDAIERCTPDPADVRPLVARVRALEALRDDLADAFDGLVLKVWRATGETHEPPADVAALLRRVAEEHKALVGFRRAMLDVHEALDGVRPEPDFDMPAELGSYACDEVARLKAAVLPAGHVAVDRALYEAACRLAADVPRLQREVVAARREGAEAMREACAARAKDHAAALMDEATGATRRGRSDVANSFSVAASAAGSIATAIRDIPLPGGEP